MNWLDGRSVDSGGAQWSVASRPSSPAFVRRVFPARPRTDRASKSSARSLLNRGRRFGRRAVDPRPSGARSRCPAGAKALICRAVASVSPAVQGRPEMPRRRSPGC